MTKALLFILSVLACWLTLVYSAISFYHLSLNPTTWTSGSRGTFSMFGIGAGALMFFVGYITICKEKSKSNNV